MRMKRLRNGKLKLWAVLFWLAVWQIAAMITDLPLILPAPADVFMRLYHLVREGSFWASVLNTFSHIALGFSAAFVLGAALAFLASRFRLVRDLLAPLMLCVKSIPVASFVILAIIWFTKYWLSSLIAFTMVLPVIYTNLLDGLSALDPQLTEMAAVFRLSAWKRFRYVDLVQLLPFLRTGLSVSLGLCWKSGVAAELIGVPKGTVGQQLYNAKIYLETTDVFAWTLIIVLISILFQKLIMGLVWLLSRRLERM